MNGLEKQVLTTVFDKGEITSEETAKIINRGKTNAVKLLNKLVNMSLIVWVRTSKQDSKGKYIMKTNSVQFRSDPFSAVQCCSMLFIHLLVQF